MDYNIDYYKVLEFEEIVDIEKIKKQYRVLVKKYHPDVNPHLNNAHEKMVEINAAYIFLSDSEAKYKYDTYYRHKKTNQNSYTSSNFNRGSKYDFNENYQFEDETLNRWMKNAFEQAQKMTNRSVEELIGVTKAAGQGLINGLIKAVFAIILINIFYHACK
jgi:DnaJ-class molecular chaperone